MNIRCRICSGSFMKKFRDSRITTDLSSWNFSITDSNYGVTGELWHCSSCGFVQCVDVKETLPYYEALADDSYENDRNVRALQFRKLIRHIEKYRHDGTILDVGAGSGIFVEEARTKGFDASGIEPSRWLQEKAKERGLPVDCGTLDDIPAGSRYDIITCFDVVEHVVDPLNIMKKACCFLADNGIFLLTTPDRDSFAARLFRKKWWHYRIAHVGYFNRESLGYALHQAGFSIVSRYRPCWYFTGSYLFERIKKYLPEGMHCNLPDILQDIPIPVNPFDSFLVICAKSKG